MKKTRNITVMIILSMVVLYTIQIIYTKMKEVPSIVILGYHHIVPDIDKERYFKNTMWVNSLSSFDEQMKLLHDEGYKSVSLEDVYAWKNGDKELDEKSVVISFDDGFYSSIKFAQPILKKYDFTGSVFVIGSAIAPQRSEYDPTRRQHASLKDMQHQKNLSFYSHSYDLHHKDDGFRVHKLSKQQLLEDTKKEKEVVSIEYYAYPYGKYNETIQNVLKEQHTKLAFTYNENRRATLQDDPYALPRFNVNAYTKLDVFKQMIE